MTQKQQIVTVHFNLNGNIESRIYDFRQHSQRELAYKFLSWAMTNQVDVTFSSKA